MTKILHDTTAGCFLQEDQQGLLHRLHSQEPFRQDPKEGLESQARRRHPHRCHRAEKLRAAAAFSPLLRNSHTRCCYRPHVILVDPQQMGTETKGGYMIRLFFQEISVCWFVLLV